MHVKGYSYKKHGKTIHVKGYNRKSNPRKHKRSKR